MTVRIHYMTQVRAVLGLAGEEVELAEPSPAASVLNALAECHGDRFREIVLDAEGRLRPSVLVCLGDEQLDASLQTLVKPGDELTILSAISGG